jgi:hypothetical protein
VRRTRGRREEVARERREQPAVPRVANDHARAGAGKGDGVDRARHTHGAPLGCAAAYSYSVRTDAERGDDRRQLGGERDDLDACATCRA